MSTESPHRLLKLAIQSLLRDEALAMEAMEHLPGELFPPVFTEAFTRGHAEVVKVMVQAWPFPYLPLRSLMDLRTPNPEYMQFGDRNKKKILQTFEALLDGLDICLSQKVHHRRWKLQVLDWRDGHRDFWTAGPRAMNAAPLADSWNKETGKLGLTDKKPTLTIFANLCFEPYSSFNDTHDKLQLCLLNWVRKRKASVHLYSEKVMISSSAVFKILKLLQAVHLDSIRELEVFSEWSRKGMKAFVPQLKKMKNLHTFRFSSLSPNVFTAPGTNKLYSLMYAFHLGQLQNLREFHMDDVFFLHGSLHKIFRSQTPLEALSLCSSPLKESDLKHLSQCASTSQLKSLILRNISMKSFNPGTLQALIHKLASTLETLALEHCDITDSHLLAILPALSCCSRLKTFSYCGNHISLDVLLVLLRLTAGLSQLSKGLYPAPVESYECNTPTTFVHPEQFAQVCAELAQVLQDIRPSLRIQICTYCYSCMMHKFYSLEHGGNWEVTEEDNYLRCSRC
ncbi:PREDICTED: PRAME family member 12-like [Chinchilla lanigera]|uniref:PRAME family member 12-like n=1 Tax=Chinchilla lanigera TaxID=34839 RepID=UPI000698B643|nr:PREDICTED: PRAME family member 12-like [Chinchilla lanigera]